MMEVRGEVLDVRACGHWTAREGAVRADRLPWSSRRTAGPLARIATHALGVLWEAVPGLEACPIVVASADGEPSADAPWSSLARDLRSVEGVGDVTVVAASGQTVAAGLWWVSPQTPTIVVWVDGRAAEELAVAVLFEPGGRVAQVTLPQRMTMPVPRRPRPNPCDGALRLFASFARGGTVVLDSRTEPGVSPWCCNVIPGS